MSSTEDTPHAFTEDDLLAYLRGSAAPDLADRIAAARKRDDGLAAELALMEGLKPALAGAGDPAAGGDLAWRRLEAEIKRESAPARSTPANRDVVWRIAAVAFGLAALGQAAYLTTAPTGGEVGYETVTEGGAAHVLVVGFAPDAPEAEIRELLRGIGGRIVDGPAASGLYRVAFDAEAALTEGRAALEAAEIITVVLDQ